MGRVAKVRCQHAYHDDEEHAELLSVNTLNVDRIKIFNDMVNGIGKDLQILDVGCGDGVISEPLIKEATLLQP